jgi:hypothetical protein
LASPSAEERQPLHREIVDFAWQNLLDADDRTSPAEYPEMCLITRDELSSIIAECMGAAAFQASEIERLRGELAAAGEFLLTCAAGRAPESREIIRGWAARMKRQAKPGHPQDVDHRRGPFNGK